MNKDILKEAIAEAKQVKSVAIENAKEVLIESFTPRIQSMLSSKIQEEDTDDGAEMEFGDEEGEEEEEESLEEADVMADQQKKDDKDVTQNFKGGTVSEEFGDEEEEFEEEPMEEPMEESDDEFGEEPEEEYEDEEDLEIESILDELDAEEDEESLEEPVFDDEEEFEEDGVEEANVLDGQQKKNDKDVTQDFKGESVSEGEFEDNPDVTNSSPDEEDTLEEDEEINLDELLKNLDEAGWPGEENSEYKDKEEQQVVKQLESLRKSNNSLKKQLSEYKKAVNFLRQELKEINLLNTKLLHTTKIFKNFNINSKSRKDIIETFDRAKTPREVKLIYATLYESYKAGGKKLSHTKRATSLVELTESNKGASGQVQSTKVPEKVVLVEGQNFVNRMKKLANIK